MAKSLVYARSWLILLAAINGHAFGEASGQTPDKAPQPPMIAVKAYGPIGSVEEAEFRLGASDRIFLIEDQWEFDRCARLLPTLPRIDLQEEALLIVMSWKYTPRTLKSVRSEHGTMIIELDEAKPPGAIADSYHPPKFLCYKLPAWSDSVRIEVNGEPRFTILRGEALAVRTAELWEEMLRIHSGGKATREQLFRHYGRIWPNASEKEIKGYVLGSEDKYRRLEPSALYRLVSRDLIDIRAMPALPRIFALIESMGPHDDAFEPACQAVIGIGGSDVVDHCKKGLESWNPRARHAAILILTALALPETRGLAHEKLVDIDSGVTLGALNLLRRLGIDENDVPPMILALEQVEKFYIAHPVSPSGHRRSVSELSNYVQISETAKGIIYAFGGLGPAAEKALPVLERFASDPRLPSPGFRPDAKKAIEKIKP